MRIFINGDLVDFEAPIYATEDQREKIITFFRHNFPDIILENVNEPAREYKEKKIKKQHKWTAKDYLKLFSANDNEMIANEIGLETSMGPQVKRGTFVMNFLKWKKQKGQNLSITENLIKEYLDEEKE